MSKNEFNNAIRNVDDDISKCEEFLCKVLNARIDRPLQLTALQNALDKHKLMANNRQVSAGSAHGSRAQKSVRHLTPPVKLTKCVPTKQVEHEVKVVAKDIQNEKTYQSRSVSCCSVRSSKPSAQMIDEVLSQNNMEDIEQGNIKCRTKSSTHIVAPKQSWSQLLAENRKTSTPKIIHGANILPGTFSQFDPLRTLHFLSKELQSKLYAIAPEETAVHRIVSEIQHSLHRLPIPSKHDILAGNAYIDMTAYLGQQYLPNGHLSQGSQTSAIAIVHRQVQTEENMDSANQLQKELEFSCLKLELNCKNLSEACTVAQTERDEMRDAVQIQKNNNNLLKAEIEEIKKQNSGVISANVQKIIDDLKAENQALKHTNEIVCSEKQFKINLLEEKIDKLKKSKDNEYSSYMSMKLELDKKNALISAKDVQLEILTKELHRVQDMVKVHMCDNDDNVSRDFLSKSNDRLLKNRDKRATPTSSLSTLPESVMTQSPSRELKYNNISKLSKADHYGVTFLSKSYDSNIKDRSSFKDVNPSQHDSRYSLSRRFHDRKHRPGSPMDQESKLTMKDSVRLDKIADDTEGGSQGDMATVADIFNDIRQEVMKTANVTLPSPPRQYQMPDVSSSQSQWSDST